MGTIITSRDHQVTMPHSFGYRARTRHLFARKFRQHGPIKLSTYLRPFHAGDIVDIKANAAEQKGMPHKYYHGRTGVVFNVAPRAVGVIIYKVVGNRYIEKRVNVRVQLKRLPAAPRVAHTLSMKNNTPETLAPQAY